MGTNQSAIQGLIRRAASAYTAGPSFENARAVCERLAQEGIASTVGYWNTSFDSPPLVAQSYLGLLSLIECLRSPCYLSVKAPALGFDLELLRRILDQAQRINVTVHFDAMAPETVDRTFELIEEARCVYPNLSCTLPGRWHRSLRDADRAVEFGLSVRVVKGEWAGLNGDETDRYDGFVRVVERLTFRGARHVAVATHDAKLARQTLSCLELSGCSCELELLYGLPQRAMQKIAREKGVRARIYVPYGRAGLPYRLREAVQHPKILTWFARDLIRGSAAI
jgi:proline dehydrogenase